MSIWKSIDENPNYIVSNNGRVRRVGCDRDHSTRIHDGYELVDLYSNGRRSTRRVHRLVANAFLPNPDNMPEVDHLDGNKTNNSADNLEWVSTKENCRRAWENGLAKPSYGMLGKRNPNSGRNGIPFRIIETGEVFETAMECAEKIGGNHRHINDCLRGRQRSHRGFHFEYI